MKMKLLSSRPKACGRRAPRGATDYRPVGRHAHTRARHHTDRSSETCILRQKVALLPSFSKQQFPCENMVIRCVLPTWWLLRGGCTRSHSEHGRETPQRQWYSVLRRGRVGRCRVCKTQQIIKQSSQSHSFGPADTKGRESGLYAFKRTTHKADVVPLEF